MIDYKKLYEERYNELKTDIKQIIDTVFFLTLHKGISEFIYRIYKNDNIIHIKVKNIIIILKRLDESISCEISKNDLLYGETFLEDVKFSIYFNDTIENFDYIINNEEYIRKYNEDLKNMNEVSNTLRKLRITYSL